MILKDGIWNEFQNDDVQNILMTSEQARKIKEFYLRSNDRACRQAIQQVLDILEITVEGINLY